MLGKMEGWVAIDGLTHTELWVKYNLLYVNLQSFYSYSTVLSVEFAQTSYRGSEGSGFISVTLQLIGGISTNEIAVTVTPSNQSPISAIGE